MKNIKYILWGTLLILSGLWLLNESLPETFNYFNFRFLANQYSGTIAIATMSLCMFLAIRPKWLEKTLNGLDKGYRLHKWLGITALIATLTHFWFTHGTKWLVAWGLLARPNRQRRPMQAVSEQFSLEQWLGGFRKIAESVGEWAFYIALILLVMALVKRIPYHWFKKLHKWLALTYLAFVFHTVILFKFTYWTTFLGAVMAILLIIGSYSAVVILSRKIGATYQTTGTITHVQHYPESNSVELLVDVPNWQGHKAGQFVFLTHAHFSEPHPFTLASHHTPLRFLVKHLGDDTACLQEKIQVGDSVCVEGAYGCFDFNDDAEHQVWIAAGIGITPFLARLDELIQTPKNQLVTLFYSYHSADQMLLNELQQKSTQADVQLILWHSASNGRLDAEKIKTESGLTEKSSIWFCGNSSFGQQLKQAFAKNHFHQELFEMR